MCTTNNSGTDDVWVLLCYSNLPVWWLQVKMSRSQNQWWPITYLVKLKLMLKAHGTIYRIISKGGVITKSLPPDNNLSVSIVLIVCAQWLSYVWLFATLWTVAHQVLLSMGFPRQEYWSRLPFPPPEDFPKSGIKAMFPAAPALVGKFFIIEPPGKPTVLLIFTSVYLSDIISGIFSLVMKGTANFFLGNNDPPVIYFLNQERKKKNSIIGKPGCFVYHSNWQGFSSFCQFRTFVHEYLGVVNCARFHWHSVESCAVLPGHYSLCHWGHSEKCD